MIFSGWSLRAGLVGICLGLLGSAPSIVAGEAAARLTFEQHVRPILKAHCFQCHGEEAKPKARLDLRLVRTMTKGGTSGAAIVAGRHEESLLWERIDADEMPPGEKKLSSRAEGDDRRLDRPGGGDRPPRARGAGRRRGGDGGGADVLVVPADSSSRGAPRSGMRRGCERRSTRSCSQRLEAEGSGLRPRGRPAHLDPPAHVRPDRPAPDARGGGGVRRRRLRPMPTSGWSTGCSPRRSTASAGPGTGSTSPATPTATAIRPRTSSGSTPRNTATTWSAPSTPTARGTS